MIHYRFNTLFVLSVFVLSSFSCFGQNKVAFKGIPLGISRSEFVRQLREKGFTENTSRTMSGPLFPGNNAYGALVHLYATENTHKVWMVHVQLPRDYIIKWTSEEGRFREFAELFINKYGETSIKYQDKHQNGVTVSEILRNTEEIVARDSGTYILSWEIGNGAITLYLMMTPNYATVYDKKKIFKAREPHDEYIYTEYSIMIVYRDDTINEGDKGIRNRINDI